MALRTLFFLGLLAAGGLVLVGLIQPEAGHDSSWVPGLGRALCFYAAGALGSLVSLTAALVYFTRGGPLVGSLCGFTLAAAPCLVWGWISALPWLGGVGLVVGLVLGLAEASDRQNLDIRS